MKQKAKFVEEIVVKDPDTGSLIEMEVYKHENGGMFAIDSSYLDDKFGDRDPMIQDPFGHVSPMDSDVVTLEEK